MRNVTARGGIHSGGLRAEGIRRAWLKYFVVQMARGAVPSGLGPHAAVAEWTVRIPFVVSRWHLKDGENNSTLRSSTKTQIKIRHF